MKAWHDIFLHLGV